MPKSLVPPSTEDDTERVVDIDVARRVARLGGERIELGGRAFDLLVALSSRPGSYFDAATLQATVWRGRVVEPSNLRMQVNQLRQRLGSDAISHQATRGYRLEIPIRQAAVVQSPRLIGRELDRRRLEDAVARHRLLTITGAGGIGKTSLVRAWFEQQAEGPGLGTAWVDLSGAVAAQVVPVTAAALRIVQPAGMATGRTLARALPERALLLVLDNAEHLAAAVSSLVLDLLQHSARTRIVVTSQIPLRLPQEQVLRLGPLDVPEPGEAPAAALRHGALQLFVERVQALDPAFVIDATTLSPAVALCRRLDGLPLAIELAAARVPALGVTALAQAMDERLQLLHSPVHSRPQRQQTLRAALEWTYGLLDAVSQAVFTRLGVFMGPFSLKAAVDVATDEPGDGEIDRLALADAIGALVDASMLALDADEPGGAGGDEGLRYRMLETPRLFALQCLHQSGQADEMRRRHLRWCLRWVARAGEAELRAGQAQLRTALEWALSGGDTAAGHALAQQLVGHPGIAALASPTPADSAAARSEAPPGDAGELARLLERLRAAGAVGRAHHAGLSAGTLEALARRLQPDEMRNVEGAMRELDHAMDLAHAAVVMPHSESGADTDVDRALADIGDCIRDGRFDESIDRLEEALLQLERREARRREAYRESQRRLIESGIQQDLLRRDAFAAARRTEALVALGAPEQPTESPAWLERERQAMRQGRASTGLLWLRFAAEMARRRLAAATTPVQRLSAQRALAAALSELGEREAGTGSLDEAAQVCRDAVAAFERIGPNADTEADAEARAAWGAIQHALGAALLLIGQRRGDTAALEQALVACEAALTVRTRHVAPLDWAATQHTRGNALRCLGMFESGTLRLEQAAQVLQEALLERTAGRNPIERARTLNILGITHSIWASREDGAERHREALALQQAALALVARDDEPLLWAALCNNIGIEHNFLASAGIDPETGWRAAIDAYRRALLVQTRDTAPHLWSRLQHNLGEALAHLGEHLSEPTLLGEACEAYRASLLENTRGRNPPAWAASTNNLGTTLMRRGWLTPDSAGSAMVEEGLRLVESTLAVRTRDAMPNEWLRTSGDVALAGLRLGQHLLDASRVRQALDASRALLREPVAAQMPFERGQIEKHAAEAEAWLAQHGARRSAPQRRATPN